MSRWSFKRQAAGSARGFTILELMVATIVFSIVLLLVTAGIIQIARVYYKGVTEANTQNTARNIIDTISQAIQFSGGDVEPSDPSAVPGVGTNFAFCVSDQQFSYRLGWQVENNPNATNAQSWHALVQYPQAGCISAAPQDLAAQSVLGRELLGRHMRLTKLLVQSVGPNLYKVQVRVVYGDNDLLTDPTSPDTVCKNQRAGTQFCSISELSTIVVKRVK